jgi:hypothetical protein
MNWWLKILMKKRDLFWKVMMAIVVIGIFLSILATVIFSL